MKSKKILIIGGSGFVGSFLIELLKKYNVENLDKNPSPFYDKVTTIGNILNIDQINKSMKNVSCVVLLAAEHKDNVYPKSLYYDVNVNGTINVLKSMQKYNINNLIFTSSVAVYGLNKNYPNEDSKKDPFNDYGKSKMLAENEIQKWYSLDPKNKSITILRPTVIFGERNRGNVYNLLKQIASNKFLMIGNGNNKKSMAYVRNVVSFIKYNIDNPPNSIQIYNYVDKPDYTMNKLVFRVQSFLKKRPFNFKIPIHFALFIGYLIDMLSYISKKNLLISSVRVKKFCATTSFNSDKLNEIFSPPFSVEDGLKKTLEYEFLNKDKIDDIRFYSE